LAQNGRGGRNVTVFGKRPMTRRNRAGRSLLLVAGSAACSLLLFAGPAAAGPVTFGLEARVTAVSDSGEFGGLHVGGVFSGRYTFDSSSLGTPFAGTTQYSFSGAPFGATFDINGGLDFPTFSIGLINDDLGHLTPDVYRVYSPGGFPYVSGG